MYPVIARLLEMYGEKVIGDNRHFPTEYTYNQAWDSTKDKNARYWIILRLRSRWMIETIRRRG